MLREPIFSCLWEQKTWFSTLLAHVYTSSPNSKEIILGKNSVCINQHERIMKTLVQFACIISCNKDGSVSNFSPKIDKELNIKGTHNVYVIEMVQL